MNQLTFTHFRVWEVVVPARADILSAPSKGRVYVGATSWPEMPIHLVEGVTSAGFTALGECGRGTPRGEVEATLRGLLGQNLLTFAPATAWMGWRELPQSYPLWSWEMAGERNYELLETLWLDAMGKAAGVPAHVLLGGAVRNAVLTAFWANRPAAPTLLALIREAKDRGLHGIKIKSDSTGDTARALLEIAPDLPHDFFITIDPMNAWRSLRESARWLEALAKLPCTIQIEDPFPYLVVDDWRSARHFRPLTIICHARSEEIFRNALRQEMADAYNLGGGSAYGFLQVAHVAEFFGKDCWQGSALELGVLQHLRLHVAACVRNCLLASDLQSEWVREHTLVTPRMQYADGHALAPSAPGLGVTLDHAALPKYTRSMFEVQS
jgi:L-alanine-DL-glutamate epimerase-like enolase superfamily enzyme